MKFFFARTFIFVLGALTPVLANAVSPSVCDRTPAIRDFLVTTVQKTCESITDEDLLKVTAVRIPGKRVTELHDGDFAGLEHAEVVNLKRNLLTELPLGIFSPVTDLRVLVLLGNKLQSLPEDFTVGNNKIEKIHMFRNAFTSLSPKVIENLKALPKLNYLEVGKELDSNTDTALWNAFPRENERVTLAFN